MRRLGPRGDGGAGAAEYAGLVVLAALILGALWAVGIPSKVETHVSAALCHILDKPNCAKPQAGGQDGTGGQNGTGNGGQNGGQNNGGENGRNGDGQGNGDEPSLADLQKNADNAQKAADNASGQYGNIKQEIIDLLKDFIGITDIENCITKGSISSCLWAALDVGSWIFAALKIAKFAKAIVKAVKLWKDFNRGRKIIDRAKNAAKRAKELLKRRRLACGLPAAWTVPQERPGRVVHAALAEAPASYGVTVRRAAVAVLPARGPGRGRCYVPAPKQLNSKAFPKTRQAKAKTPVQGGGGLRKRWVDDKGNIYEWDSQHGAVEKYNKRGKHLGEYDPQTGKQTKPADPKRHVQP